MEAALHTSVEARLVMLGPASETRAGSAAVVQAYRDEGLFGRWPIDFLAIRSEAGAARDAALLLKALRRFAALLCGRRRLVLHVQSELDERFWRGAPFMAAALAAGCPVILQLHGGAYERFYEAASEPAKRMLCFFLEHAACVVVPAEPLRGWVRSRARAARTLCVPGPVPGTRVQRKAQKRNLVLFFGRLHARKGIFDLLEAVAALRSQAPEVRLVCAGKGDRAAVQRYAQRLGIADAVQFTGWLGPSGKRALFESAAALALPSYEEALPMSVLEAMGAGVPVVVSPVGGLSEMVVDGVSGFLAAPGDTGRLKRALAKLLLDPALGARIGAAAGESVRFRCSAQRVLAPLEELYSAMGLVTRGEPLHSSLPGRARGGA
ncbi:MAG TPA: glycosyltransferase family 4 protein [Burkholderiales bacterium]|nr:glycosyltransferase family 4 protein [Burkholderiales bacterium]